MIAESRVHGLKAEKEELENEKDPQKPPELPRSSSAQKSDWTFVEEAFHRKILTYCPWWASRSSFHVPPRPS